MLRNKKDSKDLRKHYFLIWQTGLILALVIFLVAFEYNMGVENKEDDKNKNKTEEQEVVEAKEVVRTKQVDKPPRPPSPQPPVEVPNSEVIEGDVQKELDNINQQTSSGKKLSMPPPPDKGDEEEKVFKVVEQQPKLIGGLDSLRSLIEYPEMARKANIEGRVYVQFIVNKQGKVEDPKVVRGPGAGLNKEALRVIKKARFQPGIQQGHPVNVRYTMPIIFSLDQNRGS